MIRIKTKNAEHNYPKSNICQPVNQSQKVVRKKHNWTDIILKLTHIIFSHFKNVIGYNIYRYYKHGMFTLEGRPIIIKIQLWPNIDFVIFFLIGHRYRFFTFG